MRLEYKTCTKCGKTFPATTEFFHRNSENRDGLRSICKDCAKVKAHEYNQTHKEQVSASDHIYYETHKEEVKAASRAWRSTHKEQAAAHDHAYYETHKEEIAARKRIYNRAYNDTHKEQKATNDKAWKHQHREYLAEYKRQNLLANPALRISASISRGMWKSLRGEKSGRHWEDLVGYTLDDLVHHLESQFTEGMTWDNMGREGWSIDHRKPIKAHTFTSPDDPEFKQCWSLENLQPMWFRDNCAKNARYQGVDYRRFNKSAGGQSCSTLSS